jgi:GAF domain-containing protein
MRTWKQGVPSSVAGFQVAPKGTLNFLYSSLNAVRLVASPHEKVFIDDAVNNGAFINDAHTNYAMAKSLLCMPLLSRGIVIGILYLKNNLTANTFASENIQFLEMLLSQAATSMENAGISESGGIGGYRYRPGECPSHYPQTWRQGVGRRES